MDRRKVLRLFGTAAVAAQLPLAVVAKAAEVKKKGVMLMNRIAPSVSELYIANLDGSNERKLLKDSAFDYNASRSADGKWLLFTSERRADGQSDIYRARADGSGSEVLVSTDSMEDAGVLSPDGKTLAFVSTANGYRANIWVRDMATGKVKQITGIGGVKGRDGKPDCYFRPSWSPDSKWIGLSSDRDTEWTGHDQGQGWEHTQELAIYIIRPDGSGFRQVVAKKGYCLGSPQWSPDGKRLVFYEMTVEATWGARRPNYIGKAYSQIVSVDVATGRDRTEHTAGTDLKLQPQYLSNSEIGYLVKYGPNEGLAYTSNRPPVKQRFIRSPSWSTDGKSVIYEKVSFKPVRPLLKPLFSWDPEYDYRHVDVYPLLSRDGWIVYTDKQLGNSSIWVMRPDGSDKRKVFESSGRGLDEAKVRMGLAGAFQPCWSPDGEWIAFGLGYWFAERNTMTAGIWRIRRDGSGLEQLTDGTLHSGFPSYSADGKELVFRVWSAQEKGLRILNLDTRKTRVLTTGIDNLPGWSPDGQRIVFTRRRDDGNYDVYTIRPDGSDLFRATDHASSDGHAVWAADGRIMWSGSQHGFRDEAALYEQTFQQYGQIYVMNADGSNKRLLTDSRWEDSMPLYLPAN